MNETSGIEIEIARGVATLWLNRPQRRNAFDEALIGAVTAAIEAASQDPAVRVLVVGGRGKAFCAGADLEWMERLAGLSHAENHADAERLARMFHALAAFPKPTIARVQGACFGGGIGLVAACDFAIAVTEARFCFSEVRIGLIPATIAPYVLRAIGPRAAARYMLSAETVDATVAAQLGLVSSVVGADQLDAAVAALTAALVVGGPRAQAKIKRLVRDLTGQPMDEAMVLDTAARIADARSSDEGREGIRAMLEKRPPAWHDTPRE
jgi:methylglutaconyl-CoA hydratase